MDIDHGARGVPCLHAASQLQRSRPRDHRDFERHAGRHFGGEVGLVVGGRAGEEMPTTYLTLSRVSCWRNVGALALAVVAEELHRQLSRKNCWMNRLPDTTGCQNNRLGCDGIR